MAYSYRGSEYKEDFRQVVPEGEQNLMIESVTEKKSKKGNDMVEIILKKDAQHFNIYHYILLDNEWTTKNVGDLLGSCGVSTKTDRELVWSSLVGEWLTAKVQHEEFQKRTNAVVRYFIQAKKKDESQELKREPPPLTRTDKDNDIPF
jgi:hypothetical protein